MLLTESLTNLNQKYVLQPKGRIQMPPSAHRWIHIKDHKTLKNAHQRAPTNPPDQTPSVTAPPPLTCLPPRLCKNKENAVTALASQTTLECYHEVQSYHSTLINKSLQKALQTKGQILTKCHVQMQIYGELTAAQPGNPPALALPQPGVTPRVVQGC